MYINAKSIHPVKILNFEHIQFQIFFNNTTGLD